MSDDSFIYLGVSVGEAIDKLSILDIKLNKIQNEDKKKHIENEYNHIKSLVTDIMEKYTFHYNCLLDINLSIWEKQDEFRYNTSLTEKERNDLCMSIIEYNDRRFKIKNKINIISDSKLKEQKSYNPKKIYLVPHLNIGDLINTVGAVRYYSTIYDEVLLACMPYLLDCISDIYRDDPSIKVIPAIFDRTKIESELKPDIYYMCGYHSPSTTTPITNSNVPACFYTDMRIPFEYHKKFFYIQCSDDGKHKLDKLKDIPYIFCHEKSSSATVDLSHLLSIYKDHLILCNDRNMYNPEHKYYKLANIFIKFPITDCVELIKNADALHLIDSCMFCIANNIELKSTNNFVYTRSNRQYPGYIDPSFRVINI